MKLTKIPLKTSAIIMAVDDHTDAIVGQYFTKLGIIEGREIKLLHQGLFNSNAIFLVNDRIVNIPKQYQKFIIIKKK